MDVGKEKLMSRILIGFLALVIAVPSSATLAQSSGYRASRNSEAAPCMPVRESHDSWPLFVLTADAPPTDGQRNLQHRRSAWLGVVITPVSHALATHLRISEGAVMVRNIYQDSPADQADLDQHDVIVAIQGDEITQGPAGFLERVQHLQPGDTLEMTVIHAGKRIEKSVKLAEPPVNLRQARVKFQKVPNIAVRRGYGLRGRILVPSQNGWQWKDIGQLPQFQQLYEQHLRSSPLELRGSDLQHAARVDAQGNRLEVRRRPTGAIEVRRFSKSDTPDEAPDVEMTVYKNLKALEQQDPEAYRLLQTPDEAVRFELEDDKPTATQPSASMSSQQQALLQSLRDATSQDIDQADGSPRDKNANAADESSPRFEVSQDGEISVHIQTPEGQISRTFASEDAFKDEAPKLYQQYSKLKQLFR
jgi:hypothetical protein